MIAFFSSLSLPNLIALFGMLSIVIPILIHIINPSRGRVVFIGNVDFVKQVKKLNLSEVKLTRLMLLMLRIVILVLLAILLAGLYWESNNVSTENSHVYLSSSWLQNTNKSEMETLLNEHASDDLYLLNENFTKISSRNEHQLSKLMTFVKKSTSVKNINVTGLISELDSNNSWSGKTFLYVTNILNQYSGEQASYTSEYQWRVKNINALLIQNKPMVVDVIYDASRKKDHSYLAAVFEFIKQGNQQLSINYHLSTEKFLDKSIDAQWIFWLSDIEAPVEIMDRVKQGSYLLLDAHSKAEKDNKTSRLAMIENVPVRFHQISAELTASFTLAKDEIRESDMNKQWLNDSGKPLIMSVQFGKGRVFQFASRFNHQWTNLVENGIFPKALTSVIQQVFADSNQKLVVASEIENTKLNAIGNTNNKQPLYRWLILLISFLWLLERWLSERKLFVDNDNGNDNDNDNDNGSGVVSND